MVSGPDPWAKEKRQNTVSMKQQKSIGNTSKSPIRPRRGNGPAAAPNSWARAILQGGPCKTNGKSTFSAGAACVAPHAMVLPCSENTVN